MSQPMMLITKPAELESISLSHHNQDIIDEYFPQAETIEWVLDPDDIKDAIEDIYRKIPKLKGEKLERYQEVLSALEIILKKEPDDASYLVM